MTNQATHTLQVWPSGDGYEYHGDPFADAAHRIGKTHGLRKHSYNGGPPERWRKGTADEWAAITADLRAQMYIDREILKCDSMLVSDLLQDGCDTGTGIEGAWSLENVTNLYPDPSEWDEAECREWLDDHGVNYSERRVDLADLQSEVRDHAEPAEIFEWWAVTSWLAEQLTAIGEPVLDNGYGYWWGRTCTGQAMKMDGTLQKIARRRAWR